MHPAPIKIAPGQIPPGASYQRTLASGEHIYTHGGKIYAVDRWDSLKMGDHVLVKLGFPEFIPSVWKNAVVEDDSGKDHGFVILVTYDGVEVSAGPETIR